MSLFPGRQWLVAAVAAVGVALGFVAQADQGMHKSERYKVILQVSDNDPGKWNLALNNAHNIQQNLGPDNVDVEIVAYGPGLPMLKLESKVGGRLAQALDGNVKLIACENTMRKTHLTKADMYGGISYVPGGVVHIMKRESEGWAYVRP
jgi:intracellular sulfur oxidation DsrE/DsrF family protein